MKELEDYLGYHFTKDGQDLVHKKDAVTAIKEAVVDAIRECAERATQKTIIGSGYKCSVVDKESILNLIKEVK